MLQQHIEYILQVDPFFSDYWKQLDSVRQENFWNLNRDIENVLRQDNMIIPMHRRAHEYTKRFFLMVQEKDFEYTRIPDDWSAFVRDAKAKKELYHFSSHILKQFVSKCTNSDQIVLYGGVKADSSIDRKIGIKRSGNAIQQNLRDLWDVVRFRIVAPNLPSMLEIGVGLWETFFDDVIRCRNYYYRPKSDHIDDPYRAIHLEIEVSPGRMIEVQLVSRIREVISFLDHCVYFKRHEEFINDKQEIWLLRHMWKANILDVLPIKDYSWNSVVI